MSLNNKTYQIRWLPNRSNVQFQTSLRSLGLKSLKRVNSGSIVIVENQNLCYAEDIDWNVIKKSRDHDSVIQSNRNSTECGKFFF